MSLTSYPHTETAYWVIPVVDSAFSVEVVSPDYHPTTAGPFATASDAKGWIVEQRQRAQFGATRGLMALLFVGGLINLAWIGAIAALVLLEKTIPWGGQMSRLVGAFLVAWGVAGLLRMV